MEEKYVAQKKKRKQAEAELCQAQVKLGLAKPDIASQPPSNL
jgi:hypothetical protein